LAFPGYVFGHSTFSRAAAEELASITGSPYFPGGFHHHTVAANSMQIGLGPSADVDLQWATYYDAAFQSGLSPFVTPGKTGPTTASPTALACLPRLSARMTGLCLR